MSDSARRSNPRHKYKWGEEQLELSPAGRVWGCWPAASQCEPAGCPGSPRANPTLGASSTAQPGQGRAGDCAAVLRAGVASPGALPAEQFKDVQVSECIQRRATKLGKGWEECPVRSD